MKTETKENKVIAEKIVTNKDEAITNEFLHRLGQRIRSVRKQRRLTLKELAEMTGLSLRFVAQIEAGEGNIAISRLSTIATALKVNLTELFVEVEVQSSQTSQLRTEIDRILIGRSESELAQVQKILKLLFGHTSKKSISLLGLRGAGKTTIGKLLAKTLKIHFWELDERIEDIAGLSLAEIFALHGESYYRRLEGQALVELLSRNIPAVIALPGGIVTNTEAFELLKQQTITIWLRANPEDHMKRVLEQGDRRPVANRLDAMAELRAILSSREPFYEQADLTINTSNMNPGKIINTAISGLQKTGWLN
ncbi:MAG: helix-turn-helix transcriptional regulator [Blastocatellia bacterium]|nr:helix-turn-helix transcriptional regulator [Blastocatellia bacterium]